MSAKGAVARPSLIPLSSPRTCNVAMGRQRPVRVEIGRAMNVILQVLPADGTINERRQPLSIRQ